MKLRVFKYVILTAAAVFFASCLPESDYMFNDTGMYTLSGANRLIADSGDIYYITQNNAGMSIPDTLKRVMASCDVLSAVTGKDHEYNVRLNDFAGAISKPLIPLDAADPGTVGNDGVNINQAWATGGYFNAYISYAVIESSKTDKHAINLLYDNVRSNSDTLYLQLRHNAHGECPENTEHSLNDFVFAGRYISFPISDLIGSGKPVLHIEWDWYVGDQYSYTREKSTHSGDIKIQ